MAQKDKKLFFVLNLRNNTSYDLQLWYTWVKGEYIQFFIFFLDFNFLHQYWDKGQEIAKMTKSYVYHTAYLTNSSI